MNAIKLTTNTQKNKKETRIHGYMILSILCFIVALLTYLYTATTYNNWMPWLDSSIKFTYYAIQFAVAGILALYMQLSA